MNLPDIHEFLGCRTPDAWVQAALADQETLLIDHKNCEFKAASTALSLIAKYHGHVDLINMMSRLAREELVHHEQVMRLMKKRKIELRQLHASRYASGLRKVVRSHEPVKLVDTLVVGAFIEARSCERFEALVPHLDEELGKFYFGLLKSEARHFQGYLKLAYQYRRRQGRRAGDRAGEGGRAGTDRVTRHRVPLSQWRASLRPPPRRSRG